MADLKAFAEQLVNLSIKEVNTLAEILKEEYGIQPFAAAAPVVVAASDAGGRAEFPRYHALRDAELSPRWPNKQIATAKSLVGDMNITAQGFHRGVP